MKVFKFLFRPLGTLFGRIFHTRSVIIISEHKTNHIAFSGPFQFCAMTAVAACVVLASYSTGRYMATRSVLQQRDETIRSVANSRIDTNFSYTVAGMQGHALGPLSASGISPLTDPSYTLPAVNSDRLFARIALLENKVKELKDANAEIIQTVREKTQSKLINMEEIIRQTGLNLESMEEQAGKQLHGKASSEAVFSKRLSPQGGPFIPADISGTDTPTLTPDIQDKLDQLAVLSTLIHALPLGSPIPGAELQSNFGRRVDPFTGRLAFHAGMDFSGPAGTEIHATGDGKVISAGWAGAYGNAVDIDHGFGVTTRYGHMSKIGVSVGQMVKTGDVIGIQGSTGRSTGPHVHYEVRYYDRPLNPIKFLHVAANVSQTE